MKLKQKLNNQFQSVELHARNTSNMVDCSGASVMVIHNDQIVTEAYWGKHSKAPDARPIQEDSQFHVASVRKSYIGFAAAYAIHNGYIDSIDDEVTKYLPNVNTELFAITTIRHLLTHSHGLQTLEGIIIREFPPGQSWAYRDISIEILTQLIRCATGKTIAEILKEQVFNPLGFNETGWYDDQNEKLAEVIRDRDNKFWSLDKGTDGNKKNMYVSTRELAYWGYLHLKQGRIDGKQVVAKEIIQLATSLQSPGLINMDLPQNGFLWFVKDLPAKKTEIGELVPGGSFQILGYTSVAVLVIPKRNIVAVRMFNSFGSPPGYDYLADIRAFGDTVMKCV
ncbi:serine hydrolase domain-containing protein [Cytobacillus massiliigabonensis]|uniref:serine hydrolase domain-containing protein n=1 Tax=Cytobacillus massiliigabonensis TaxID=1871011 RepID=UPI000C8637CA|nr:serine hydrolase domain-containing protein [Cytobacillus massiliigabonensis]